jgi:sensor histidine kinase YesM
MKTNLLQHIWRFLLQLFFTFALDLALGGVTYFALTSYTKLMTREYNTNGSDFKSIVLGNGLEALIAVLMIRLLNLFDYKISPRWINFLILTVLVYVSDKVFFSLVYGHPERLISPIYYTHPLIVAFGSNIILATNFVYLFQRYDRKRNKKITEQEYELLELKELKTKAELEALQAKISPHFLYNSLNSIASLIHENPPKAEQMVLLLARFFRYSTNAKSQYMTPLIDEIEMVKTYLEVEKVRFDERLEYTIHFENESLQNCLIPQFLIQPLVENAIKHGISKITGKGLLEIDISHKQDTLLISISDNGVPFPKNLDTGYGLRSTQDKLRLLCGEDARLEIVSHPKKTVQIFIKNVQPEPTVLPNRLTEIPQL